MVSLWTVPQHAGTQRSIPRRKNPTLFQGVSMSSVRNQSSPFRQDLSRREFLQSSMVAAVMAVGGKVHAAEPAIERKEPLAGLPSKPGPHIDKLKALGDNEWLNLGSP